jgi:hypothetical protein
MNIFLTEN